MIKNNYHKHLGIGILIGVLTAFILNFTALENYMIIILTSFIGYVAGVIWEGEQTYRYNNVWDWWDVFFSGIGAGIGSLIIFVI
jgi:uncharacterized membrane protein